MSLLDIFKGDVEGHHFRGNQYVKVPSAGRLMRELVSAGGFTYDRIGTSPETGFAAAYDTDHSLVVSSTAPAKAVGRRLNEFRTVHRDELKNPGVFLGGWYDKKHRKFVVDRTLVFDDKEKALVFAEQEDQVSIYDIEHGEEIQVGGSGGYVKSERPIFILFQSTTPTEVIVDKLFEMSGEIKKGADADLFEISKVDISQGLVFGWAYVVSESGGGQVFDKSGDFIDASTGLEDLEKVAYEYVHSTRVGGEWHQRDGELPLHVSDLVESIVFTPEKIAKMGLPDTTPIGWWVGFRINSPEVIEKVRNGTYRMFSIHGSGLREMVG
jgi:hypothetical protein